jgi:hypothetical protein
MWLIGARFFFFDFVGRILGINRPAWHSALGLSANSLKKRYLCADATS